MSNKYQFHLTSNVGKVRNNNEDFYGEKKLPNGHVFVVCDGMGGHSGGEIASQKAVECILEYFTKSRGENPIQMIHEAIKFANSQVHGFASMNPEYNGMGTTCVVVYIHQSGRLFYGHVGDSRLYLFNRQGLRSITKDHSYVQYLVDTGEIKEHEMESHPAKNQILRALGIEEIVKPDVCDEPIIPQSGDTFLLCTDGLNGMIGNKEISEILQNGVVNMSLPDLTDKLVHHALEAGGKDNVTVALITYSYSSEDVTIQMNTVPSKSRIHNFKDLYKKKNLKRLVVLLLLALLTLWTIRRAGKDDKPVPQQKEKIQKIKKDTLTKETGGEEGGEKSYEPDDNGELESEGKEESKIKEGTDNNNGEKETKAGDEGEGTVIK